MIDFSLMIEMIPALLRGALVTLEIATIAAFIGITLGATLALAQTSKNAFLRALVTFYVTIIRGTPMLIQITFAFYGLPQLGLSIAPFWLAIIAIGLNSAAYMSQIIKAGIRSIGKGQIEAGRMLGLSNSHIMRSIVLPQAIRVITPALGNEFVTLIKDSSLASTIGVVELTKEGIFIRGRTLDAISTFVAVALIYLIMTTTISLLVNAFERRMNRHAIH